MQTVASLEQIKRNILQLDTYLHSSNQSELLFARELVRNGICFVVFKQDQRLIFAPSRFIGYVNNSMTAHERNDEKDGRDTNRAIESILGSPPYLDESSEQQYREFCRTEGLEFRPRAPFNIERKYWEL